MRKVIILTLMIIFVVSVSAQSMLFDENESGFDISYQIEPFNIPRTESLNIGYTINGKYNFGIGIKHFTNFAIDGFIITSNFSSEIINQRAELPIKIILEEYFEYGFTPSNDDIRFKEIGLKSTFLHSFDLNNLKIIPTGQIGWSYCISDQYGSSNNSNYLFGAIKCIISYKRFFLYPEFKFSKKYSDINVGLGFIIPTNSRHIRNNL
jgi:hypothetical protein